MGVSEAEGSLVANFTISEKWMRARTVLEVISKKKALMQIHAGYMKTN